MMTRLMFLLMACAFDPASSFDLNGEMAAVDLAGPSLLSSSMSSSMSSSALRSLNLIDSTKQDDALSTPHEIFLQLKNVHDANDDDVSDRPSLRLKFHLDSSAITSSSTTTSTSVVEISMMEISSNEAAMTPSTLFSTLFGGNSNNYNARSVGDLGHSFLVLDRRSNDSGSAASFAFAILDWNTFQIRGVVVQNGRAFTVDQSSIALVDSSSATTNSFGEDDIGRRSMVRRGRATSTRLNQKEEGRERVQATDQDQAQAQNQEDAKERSLEQLQLSSSTTTTTTTTTATNNYYKYQINLHLTIDDSLLQNVASSNSNNDNDNTISNPTCVTHTYLNSLFTAVNSILEWEIMSHLHIVEITTTTTATTHASSTSTTTTGLEGNNPDDDDYQQTLETLKKMYNTNIHENNNDNNNDDGKEQIHLYYALVGKSLEGEMDHLFHATTVGGGEIDIDGKKEDNENDENEDVGTVCDINRGYSAMGNIQGDLLNLSEGWMDDLRRLVRHIGRSLGSGDTSNSGSFGYEPPVDQCPMQCPENNENGSLTEWATLLSSCDVECSGGIQNVQFTLGGFYSGTGDISDVFNWRNTGNEVYNIDSKRVPHKIFTYLQTLDEWTHCLVDASDKKTPTTTFDYLSSCPIPSNSDSFTTQINYVAESSSISTSTSTEEAIPEVIRSPAMRSLPVPSPSRLERVFFPTEEPESIMPTYGLSSYQPTAVVTYPPTTPLPTRSPTTAPTQVPSDSPTTENPTITSAPSSSSAPSGEVTIVTSKPTKAKTPKPTRKPTPVPTAQKPNSPPTTVTRPTAPTPTTPKLTPLPTPQDTATKVIGGGNFRPSINSRPRPSLVLGPASSPSPPSPGTNPTADKDAKSRKRKREHYTRKNNSGKTTK